MIEIILPTYDMVGQIMRLSKKYLITSLPDKQKQDGFIRIEYSEEDLYRIIENREIVVAVVKGRVIGYYLIGRESGSSALNYQSTTARSLAGIPYNKIGYGCQVCIETDHRKSGLFKAMLGKLNTTVREKYSHLLCSISESNVASLKVHTANNWQLINTINTTHFLIYPTNK